MHFTGTKSTPQIILLLKHSNVKLAWRLPNYCNVSSWRNNLIKYTYYDQAKKMAHDSQIVGAKDTCAQIYENLLLFLMPRGLLFNSIQKIRENNSQ